MLKYCLLYKIVQVYSHPHPIHGLFPSYKYCESLINAHVFFLTLFQHVFIIS